MTSKGDTSQPLRNALRARQDGHVFSATTYTHFTKAALQGRQLEPKLFTMAATEGRHLEKNLSPTLYTHFNSNQETSALSSHGPLPARNVCYPALVHEKWWRGKSRRHA